MEAREVTRSVGRLVRGTRRALRGRGWGEGEGGAEEEEDVEEEEEAEVVVS